MTTDDMALLYRFLRQRRMKATMYALPEPKAAERPDPAALAGPPYIRIHPERLRRGDVMLDGRLHRWLVAARLADEPSPRRNGQSLSAPCCVYLMERLTGPNRGEKRVQRLPVIMNVHVCGGSRYELARQRPHPRMTHLDFSLFLDWWRDTEAWNPAQLEAAA